MQAAIYLSPGKIELQDVPVPEPGAGDILVHVRAATTCGTDVKTYRRGHPKFAPPFVFGHEFGGDVVAVGCNVGRFSPGMRVTANVNAACGQCFYCQAGQENLCDHLVYNFGAFAEYMLVPEQIVQKNTFEIPPNIPYAHAAVMEPLVCVVHGMDIITVRPGESVAVIGAGGAVSLLFIQLAKLAGAAQVIAIGHSDYRLAVAAQLGAGTLINARKQDALEAVRTLTGGRGADVVIECAGTRQAWEGAVEMVRKGGRVLWFGGLPGGSRVELDAARIHYGGISLYGTHGGTSQDARRAFELITSEMVKIEPLLSDRLPLSQVEQALKKMIAGEAVKVIIEAP